MKRGIIGLCKRCLCNGPISVDTPKCSDPRAMLRGPSGEPVKLGYLKIDLCIHFYAAVHSRSIGARLDRIPVTLIRDIIDVQLKGNAPAGDPGHVTGTDRVQGVAWNDPLVLRIDEARRNRA